MLPSPDPVDDDHEVKHDACEEACEKLSKAEQSSSSWALLPAVLVLAVDGDTLPLRPREVLRIR